jgi:hypothetical protein
MTNDNNQTRFPPFPKRFPKAEKGSTGKWQGRATTRSRDTTSSKTLPSKNQKREVFDLLPLQPKPMRSHVIPKATVYRFTTHQAPTPPSTSDPASLNSFPSEFRFPSAGEATHSKPRPQKDLRRKRDPGEALKN